jgi:hypothetical protein
MVRRRAHKENLQSQEWVASTCTEEVLNKMVFDGVLVDGSYHLS